MHTCSYLHVQSWKNHGKNMSLSPSISVVAFSNEWIVLYAIKVVPYVAYCLSTTSITLLAMALA